MYTIEKGIPPKPRRIGRKPTTDFPLEKMNKGTYITARSNVSKEKIASVDAGVRQAFRRICRERGLNAEHFTISRIFRDNQNHDMRIYRIAV